MEIQIGNVNVTKWAKNDWVLYVATTREDGRQYGFTRGASSKPEALRLAREWSKLPAAELRKIASYLGQQ